MNIYQAIKNFFLAMVVCRKYGLTYKPFCLFVNSEYNDVLKHIKLNPFHPEFNSILFHEVGHHVHHKLVNYNTFFELKPNSDDVVIYNEDLNYHQLIVAEAFASRFAMKTGKADISFLVMAFNSHARIPFHPKNELSSKAWFMSYVDCVAKYSLRITRT